MKRIVEEGREGGLCMYVRFDLIGKGIERERRRACWSGKRDGRTDGAKKSR